MKTRFEDGILTATLDHAALDHRQASAARAELAQLPNHEGGLVLDFSRVHYLDWAGLETIVQFMATRPGAVALCGLAVEPASLFALHHLHHCLVIEPTVERAMARLRSAKRPVDAP